jgi:putative transposase
MKAKSLDLRERVVVFVRQGGTKTEAGRVFGLCRKTVYNYLNAEKAGRLEPKKSWGSWRKLDPAQLAARVETRKDATLLELGGHFGVSVTAVWTRLRQLGLTLKKSGGISGKGRGAAGGLPGKTGGAGRAGHLLAGRVRGRSAPAAGLGAGAARGGGL